MHINEIATVKTLEALEHWAKDFRCASFRRALQSSEITGQRSLALYCRWKHWTLRSQSCQSVGKSILIRNVLDIGESKCH